MLRTGVTLGDRYEIVGKIGSGGMADVYKAMDQLLNRYVAVKVMKSEFQSDSSFIRKFRREAQAAAGLANPNIVNIYDVGEDQGNYYIVMELVEGITLKEYIAKKGKLSVREATSIAIQVCMGLAAAHDQGIVHRDIKPQNIIISTDGKVKVTDFGIARAASSNTISANAMGSVHYSSPEQVRGGYSDTRSDIYSLGITLYEMVTGRVPFDGDTTVAIAIKHLQDEMVPPTKYTPDLPYSLEQVIFKCTQKSVDRRYQSMNEVIADLKHSLMEPDGHFVQLTPLSDHAKTVMITPEEQEAIKAGSEDKSGPKKTFGSTEEAQKGDVYDYEDLPDEDYEDYEDDDDEGGAEISSKLEKAVTIGGFIVGALIICVLIYFIGRAAGLFRFGSNSGDSQGTAVTSEAAKDLVEVPSLIGLDETTAQSTASSMGLGIKYAGEKPSAEDQTGLIVETDPVEGTPVERNTTIYYYVGSGPDTTTVPSVVGSTLTEAQEALESAGFTNVKVETQESSEVEVNRIISVTPGEGTEVSASDEITLTVSSGAGVTKVTVRNYTGYDKATSEALASGDGLIVEFVYSYDERYSEGVVYLQSIPEGTEVDQGTKVTLTLNDAAYADAAEESSEETVPETGGTWTCTAKLGAPSNYNGEAYRLVLIQTVNGQAVETVVSEGDSISFPYEVRVTGASGVADGLIRLDINDGSGNYVGIVQWPVTFSES